MYAPVWREVGSGLEGSHILAPSNRCPSSLPSTRHLEIPESRSAALRTEAKIHDDCSAGEEPFYFFTLKPLILSSAPNPMLRC